MGKLEGKVALVTGVVAVLVSVTIYFIGVWMATEPSSARSLIASVVSLCRPSLGMPSAEEAPFLAENRTAMMQMMVGMDVRPSGDIDRDFVNMMVPHHQGAVDMASAVLRYGHNEKIRRLAQEIIVTQRQEIAVMRLAVGEPLPPLIHP